MSQTSYSLAQPVAMPGLLGDSGFHDILSGIAASAMGFGLAALKGSGDADLALPAASGDVAKVRGVTVHNQAIEQDSSGLAQYKQKSAVNVIHKGRVWVKVEEAVAPGDAVAIRYSNTYASGSGDGKGAFAKTAVTNEVAVFSDGSQGSKAKWLTSASANGLALLEVAL